MVEQIGAASGRVRIKKYGNRRLYDTSQSKYITLEDLAGIVQAGAQVEVVEAGSGKDITRQVLTQVILEQQDRLEMIPLELLHAVIRMQGTIQQGPFSAWLTMMSQQFAPGGQGWTQQMAAMFGGMPAGFGAAPPAAAAPAAEKDSEEPPPEDGGEDIAAVRGRVDALLKKLNRERKD